MVPKLNEVFKFLKENLTNVFHTNKKAFADAVTKECEMDLGKNFKDAVDNSQGWKGATDWAIEQYFEAFYTPEEAFMEFQMMYDMFVQSNGTLSPMTSSGYPTMNFTKKQKLSSKDDCASNDDDIYDRTTYPDGPGYWDKDHVPRAGVWKKSLSNPNATGPNQMISGGGHGYTKPVSIDDIEDL